MKSIKIHKRLSINAEVNGLLSEQDFIKKFHKDKTIPLSVIKDKHKECVQICKEKGLLKSNDRPVITSGETK